MPAEPTPPPIPDEARAVSSDPRLSAKPPPVSPVRGFFAFFAHKLGFRPKKPQIDPHLLGALFLEFCSKASAEFCQELQKELENTPFNPTEEGRDLMYSEALLLYMWAASSVLLPEEMLLDSMHDHYFRWICSQAESVDESKALLQAAQEALHDRYRTYYSAWNNSGAGHQWNLTRLVLQNLLTAGQQDKRLMDAHLQMLTSISLMVFMKYALELRASFDLSK